MTAQRAPLSLDDLVTQVLNGQHGSGIEDAEVSVGFVTRQSVRHASRRSAYRNHVLSLRVADAVGSCAVEPGGLPEEVVPTCLAAPVRDLVRHPLLPVRVAALDAYLQCVRQHRHHAEEVVIGRGSSLQKSLHRARFVVELLPVAPGSRVLVVGVVNSLLHHLRERGNPYIACDHNGGETEWGEEIATDASSVLDECDAVLASGMVVGNGTFEPLLDHVRATGKPLVLFAQTASGILPCFLGAGVTALSAEPYPFFWLDGGPSALYRYPAADDHRAAGKELL